mmetsp:Transcript_30529/g.27043  ORF Transcript_30529/g.27043 Transcript_30529/m.27043 type:complete len:120 (-) Transcript_30529:242-601(-)
MKSLANLGVILMFSKKELNQNIMGINLAIELIWLLYIVISTPFSFKFGIQNIKHPEAYFKLPMNKMMNLVEFLNQVMKCINLLVFLLIKITSDERSKYSLGTNLIVITLFPFGHFLFLI